MRTLMFIAPLTVALCACGNPDDANVEAAATTGTSSSPALSTDSLLQLDRYQTQAAEMIAAIDDKATDAQIQAHADELVAISEQILPDFLDAQPHCRAYLDAALALKDSWTTMTAEQIETGYHQDGALPATENAAACYHMKDLIVHPITALALLGEDADNRVAAKHEIEEVLAHLDVVRNTR